MLPSTTELYRQVVRRDAGGVDGGGDPCGRPPRAPTIMPRATPTHHTARTRTPTVGTRVVWMGAGTLVGVLLRVRVRVRVLALRPSCLAQPQRIIRRRGRGHGGRPQGATPHHLSSRVPTVGLRLRVLALRPSCLAQPQRIIRRRGRPRGSGVVCRASPRSA